MYRWYLWWSYCRQMSTQILPTHSCKINDGPFSEFWGQGWSRTWTNPAVKTITRVLKQLSSVKNLQVIYIIYYILYIIYYILYIIYYILYIIYYILYIIYYILYIIYGDETKLGLRKWNPRPQKRVGCGSRINLPIIRGSWNCGRGSSADDRAEDK